MITLFGATGYTGRKIAAVLAREGLPFRIAGRSAERLQALADSLSVSRSGAPACLVADATRPETFSSLFSGTRLLINCAGPYTDLGERVLAQAAISGVHYLDVTNELGFRYRVRSYHEMARRSGAALVPACGFEVALSDSAAAVIAREMGGSQPLDSIDVVYLLGGKGTSAGTRRSAVRALATSWIAYRNGGWVGAAPCGEVRAFELANTTRRALSFPSCEVVTVPAHTQVRSVAAWMTVPAGLRFAAPVVIPLFARLARSILGPLFVRMAGSGALRAGDQRQDDRFTIYVIARRGSDRRRLRMEGKGAYELTAEIIGYYARAMVDPAFNAAGLLAPAQAVDPAAFLAWMEEEGRGIVFSHL